MTPNPQNYGVVLERIDQVRTDIVELSTKVGALTDALQGFQLHYVEEHTRVVDKVDAAHTRINGHEQRIKDIETQVGSMQKAIIEQQSDVKSVCKDVAQIKKIMWAIFSVIGAMVVGLLWAIFTHQVTLVFPQQIIP